MNLFVRAHPSSPAGVVEVVVRKLVATRDQAMENQELA
jgi:hypothetical protein